MIREPACEAFECGITIGCGCIARTDELDAGAMPIGASDKSRDRRAVVNDGSICGVESQVDIRGLGNGGKPAFDDRAQRL
jgi:hypothetical protein